jgi:hypothetical protein
MRRMVELVERMVGCSRSWSTIAIPVLIAEHYLPFLGSVSISKILISRLFRFSEKRYPDFQPLPIISKGSYSKKHIRNVLPEPMVTCTLTLSSFPTRIL